VLVLYTEEQLHRAYKIYIRDLGFEPYPDIDIFRTMFEENEDIQQLADGEIHEH
tara:strand:+ start:2129 stop:2290 length:162 start_codon:yes stop_codon:yes gene_type:complete